MRADHAGGALASGQELVVCDARQRRSVDKELALGDAHRDQRGHVLIGHAVAIALPAHEAVDRAQSVHDARGIEGVFGQGQKRRPLGGLEDLGDALLAELRVLALVDDLDEPAPGLLAHVLQVAKATSVEEAALEIPEVALDEGFVIGFSRAYGLGLEAVVGGERQQARLVDDVGAFVARDHGFLVVVANGSRDAAQVFEGAAVPFEQRKQVFALEQVHVTPAAARQREHAGVDCVCPVGEVHPVRRPVLLGHLARPEHRAHARGLGRLGRPQPAHAVLEDRVAAGIAFGAQLLQDALGGDRRVGLE